MSCHRTRSLFSSERTGVDYSSGPDYTSLDWDNRPSWAALALDLLSKSANLTRLGIPYA